MRDGLLILLVFVLGVLIGRNIPQPAPAMAEGPAVPGPSPASVAPLTPRDAVIATTRQQDGSSTRPAPSAPLPSAPPVGTPIARSLPALRARAEAGDAEAATRWYLEAGVCARLGPPPLLGHRDPPRNLQNAADRCLQARHCDALPPEQLEPLRALRLAALAGNDDAAVIYAWMPLLNWISDPSLMTVARDWPAEAPELLARARGRGHAYAWLLTAETLTTGQLSPSLRRVLPRNPTDGLAMLWALQQAPHPGFELAQVMQGNDWAQLAARLGVSEDSLPAVRAEGDRLYQRHLRGIRHLEAEIEASRRLSLLDGTKLPAMLSDISPECAAELATDPRWREAMHD